MSEKKTAKILHIIGGGEYGGAEQYLINLALEMQDSQFELHFACFYDREFAKRLRKQDIKVYVILPRGRLDFSLDKKIAELIQKEKYQIIHTHGVRANFFGRLAVKKLNEQQAEQIDKSEEKVEKTEKTEKTRISVITTVHSVLRQDYQNPISYQLAYLLERYTQDLTDYYIAISNSIKEDIITRGIKEDIIEVIYSGINFQKTDDDNAEHYLDLREHIDKICHYNNMNTTKYVDVIRSLNIYSRAYNQPNSNKGNSNNSSNSNSSNSNSSSIDDEVNLAIDDLPANSAKIIGMVGRLQKVKGHRYAILAMMQILHKHPNTHLVIAGDGPLLDDLIQLRDQLKLINNVHFIGFQHSVNHIVKQFDIFLMPSLSEGLGLSLIEAMAEGVPSIATKVGGMVDVIKQQGIKDNGTGILIVAEDSRAIAEAAIELLNNQKLAIEMGERGKEDVRRRFDSKQMIAAMEEFYGKVIDCQTK